MNPLTRRDDVMVVLSAGGWIEGDPDRGLVHLYGPDGAQVPAWQQAVRSGMKACRRGADGLWRRS